MHTVRYSLDRTTKIFTDRPSDDFCIAEMASGLGHQTDAEKYRARSKYWKNMFRSSQTSLIDGTNTGFTGFLQPKFLNGTWGFQDPAFCSPLLNFTSCYLNPDGHETYEGSSWLYSFFAPGDMGDLSMFGPMLRSVFRVVIVINMERN